MLSAILKTLRKCLSKLNLAYLYTSRKWVWSDHINVKDTYIHAMRYESSMDSKLEKMRDETRPNNKARDLKSKLYKVKKTKTLKENVEKVLEFDRESDQNGHQVSSRCSVLITLHCLCQFAGQKLFRDFTKNDIIEFLDAAKNRKFQDTRYRANAQNAEKQLANSSMNLVRLRVKRFFQWLHGMDKKEYPTCVGWIQLKTIKGDREITPEDLPTGDEIRKMIEHAENPRDRALISLMAESGARVGEISTLLLEDIHPNDKGFVLTIRSKKSKTKVGRRIPLCACAEDVKRWVNDYHPFKNDPEAPLFTSLAGRRPPKTNLKVGGIATILTKVAARARVDRRIRLHPHIFRHARASQLAELGWNEPMLNQFFGWAKSSKMPATYIHMSQSAMHDRYYEMYGKADPEEKEPLMQAGPQRCPKCETANPHGYRFCFRCNTVLDEKEQARVEDQKDIRRTLNFIAQDTQLQRKFLALVNQARQAMDK